MNSVTLICNDDGRTLIARPVTTLGTDFQLIRAALRKAGSRYDGVIKEEVIPFRKLPGLTREAVDAGLHLLPRSCVIEGVRRECERLREETAFLEEISGDFELYPFQSEGVGYLWQNPAALLFDEMGLGKTVQALMALDRNASTLVICPAVVKAEWAKECKRWRCDLTPTVLDEFRYPEPREVCITNYERIPEAVKGRPWPGTTIILDEAHYVKNSKSKRTKKCRALIKRVQKRNGFAWMLTGTPLQNKPQELWSLLVALGLHKTSYGGYTGFAKAFGGQKDAFGYVFDEKKVTPEAIEILRAVTLRRERETVLPDLPTKTYRDFSVGMPSDKHLIDQLDNVDEDLLALCLDDTMRLEDVAFLAEARKGLALHKYKEALPLLKQYEDTGEPVVVFSAHRAPIEALAKREGWAVIMGGISADARSEAVDDFQAGKLKGIACTIQAAGVGLTLTRSHHVVFIDLSMVPTANLQAEDRVCRIGQDRGVVVTRIVSEHPLDFAVMSVLDRKFRLIDASIGQIAEDRTPSLDREALAQELEAIAGMMGG